MKQGFLLINKQLHDTAFDVIAKLRRKFGVKKIGHTGTLDPLATGLMVIGVLEATRYLEFHVGHTKEYEAEITFGAISETFDAEGPITQCAMNNEQLTIEQIEKVIKENFLGEIEQVPPKYSALKINGQKLCNLVRAGKEVDVEVKRRKITISENEIIDWDEENQKLKLRIACSTGTYIRSIAHDLGQILGCGAYLSGLRRTKVENFNLADAKIIEDISEADFLPFEAGLTLPKIQIMEAQKKSLQVGSLLEISDLFQSEPKEIYYQVFIEEKFSGVIEIKKGKIYAKKIVLS